MRRWLTIALIVGLIVSALFTLGAWTAGRWVTHVTDATGKWVPGG